MDKIKSLRPSLTVIFIYLLAVPPNLFPATSVTNPVVVTNATGVTNTAKPGIKTNTMLGEVPLIHGVKWNMAPVEIKAREKQGSLIDEFEMDRETTISYRNAIGEFSLSNEWPMNLTYFLFEGKLYSILGNYISTNEELVDRVYRSAVEHYTALLGRPKLADAFRNVTAWETNGTMLTLFLGPHFMSYRKNIFTIQFDGPDSQDIRLKLEKTRNEQFNDMESLTNY